MPSTCDLVPGQHLRLVGILQHVQSQDVECPCRRIPLQFPDFESQWHRAIRSASGVNSCHNKRRRGLALESGAAVDTAIVVGREWKRMHQCQQVHPREEEQQKERHADGVERKSLNERKMVQFQPERMWYLCAWN
jgi:hypothetical protein